MEVGSVEDIKKLPTELDCELLADLRIFDHGDIPLA